MSQMVGSYVRPDTRGCQPKLLTNFPSTPPHLPIHLPAMFTSPQAFKRNVSRVPNVARSVCSNDETVVLGISTASVDEGGC